MELRQLKYVVRVSHTLHFGKAAELEHIAPSVLSTQIRRLETELGVQLFHRGSQQVSLTAAGKHFVEHSEQILGSLTRMRRETLDIASSGTSRLRIGFFGEAAGELTHLMFSAFAELFPDTKLSVVELNMSNQFDHLVSGNIDVAMLRLPTGDPSLVAVPLFEEPRFAAVPANSPLADAMSLTASDLLDEGFAIAADGAPRAWSSYWSLDDQRGEKSRVAATVNTLPESISAIAYGNAVDTFPASAVQPFAHPGVRFVELEDAAPSVLGLVYHEGNRNPTVAHFQRIAELVVADNIGRLPGARSLVGVAEDFPCDHSPNQLH